MKTQTIEGRVIYCFYTALSADINFLDGSKAQGFIVAAKGIDNVEKVVGLFSLVKPGERVKLTLIDGQLTEVYFQGLGKSISAKNYPMLGLAMKDSVEKKVTAKFARGEMYTVGKNLMLQLYVLDAEKLIYHLEAEKSQESRMNDFLKKCVKGDTLRLSQNAEGKIVHIVNETQASEFA